MFKSVPEVSHDIVTVTSEFKAFRYYSDPDKSTIIPPLMDANYQQLENLFSELAEMVAENEEAGEHTVLWFYYSGHGLGATKFYTLHAVCRYWDKERQNFPLEDRLTTLAQEHKNLYIVGLFDRCRKSESSNQGQSNALGFMPEQTKVKPALSSYVFYFTNFSCENIKKDGTISYKFFKTLTEQANKHVGKVTLPADMRHWILSDRDVPTVINTRKDLVLELYTILNCDLEITGKRLSQ